MTRGDRHRLLDMQEAVTDLSEIVERGRARWDDEKFVRLAAQKLLEIPGEAVSRSATRSVPGIPACRGVIWPGFETSTPTPTTGSTTS